MICDVYQDLVAAHVDGILSATEYHEVEQHLASCTSCQQLFAKESRFHTAFAARQLIVPVPTNVERRLHKVLRKESVPALSWRDRFSTFFPQPRLAAGLAIAGLVIAVALSQWFRSPPEPSWVTQAKETFQAATTGQITLAYRLDDPQNLEAALNRSGQLDFVTHVLDLRAAGYRPMGGHVIYFNEHPVALVRYEGTDGPLICLRQKGPAPTMPSGSEGKKGQYLYTHAGYSFSFVQHPDHFCLLITRLPREIFQHRLGMVPAA
jgi:anti-sigma factor RsiW